MWGRPAVPQMRATTKKGLQRGSTDCRGVDMRGSRMIRGRFPPLPPEAWSRPRLAGCRIHPPSPGEEGHQEYGGPENPELDYLSHGGPSHAPQDYVYGDGSCHQCDPHGIGQVREDLEDLGATQHLWSRVEETDNEYATDGHRPPGLGVEAPADEVGNRVLAEFPQGPCDEEKYDSEAKAETEGVVEPFKTEKEGKTGYPQERGG